MTTQASNRPDVGRAMLAFNWLPASYVHSEWLGPWASLIEPREQAGFRMLRRVSTILLQRFDLGDRYVRELGDQVWLLHPHDDLLRVADELGTAMLGDWVRNRLERRQVEAQLKALGPVRRQRALAHAQTLRALPKGHPGGCAGAVGWPIQIAGKVGVFRLGISCLATLLDDPATGARERFTMRFAPDIVVPLALDSAQRDEALALIHGVLHDQPLAA